MRIRRKKWARPELEVCPYYIEKEKAFEFKGKWRSVFPEAKPLYMELGCGKGLFAAQAALKYPDVNWLALDIKPDMLGVARRTVEKAFADAEKDVSGLRLVCCNIEQISGVFAPEDTVDRLYINFCNPWPKDRHNKRRLTHPRQLAQYRTFLKDGGELHFKTDDDELFEESLEYLAESGFTVKYLTRDLHASDYPDNLVTEHERMFSEEGKKIKFLIAVKNRPAQ